MLNRLLNKELAAGDGEEGAANFPISKAVQISVDAVTLARMTMGAWRGVGLGALANERSSISPAFTKSKHKSHVTHARTHNAEFEKMLQCAAARFYSTEAASRLVPEMVHAKGKREFENTCIAAQVCVRAKERGGGSIALV